MSTPPRSPSDLIADAQRDEWHLDPLGKEILAALTVQKKVPPALWVTIALLALGLAITLGLYASQLNKVAGLEAQVVAAQAVENSLKAQVAEGQKAYDELRTSSDLVGKTRDDAKAEILKALNERIDAVTRENEQLRSENATLKGAPEKK